MDKLLSPTPSVLGKYFDVKLEAFFFSYVKWAYYPLFQFHRLDYPGVGPEHSFLRDIGRAEYDSVTDQEALDGMFLYHLCFLVMLDHLLYLSCILAAVDFHPVDF